MDSDNDERGILTTGIIYFVVGNEKLNDSKLEFMSLLNIETLFRWQIALYNQTTKLIKFGYR